jgi:diguanylate cyclase (GGDEF)-like protein
MSDATPLELLLVEDEPTQMLLMKRLLVRAGYKVQTANNGDEALGKISANHFQILVTDWDMPGMDGATLCRRVRETKLPGYLYVLLLTGHGDTQSVVAGLEAGADDYIRKPANEAELLARLNAGRRIVMLEQSLREASAKILHLSITDPLVGSYNRRYLNDQILNEVEKARRYGRPLSAVMADLDRFKSINDVHGHLVGDAVLRGFVEIAKGCIRTSSDWIARYGGEEFVIVLPETDLDGAAVTAEKVRHQLSVTPIQTEAGEIVVTASFGVASLKASQEPVSVAASSMLREADAALYRSKREGRNRVTLADESR